MCPILPKKDYVGVTRNLSRKPVCTAEAKDQVFFQALKSTLSTDTRFQHYDIRKTLDYYFRRLLFVIHVFLLTQVSKCSVLQTNGAVLYTQAVRFSYRLTNSVKALNGKKPEKRNR